MSSLSQFVGGGAAPHPTGLLNGASSFRTVVNATPNVLQAAWAPVKTVLSGTTVAGVLKTVLSLSGSGVFSFLAVENADTTSRTHRIKITLDGVVIFDATTGAVTSVSNDYLVVGVMTNVAASTHSVITFEPLSFNSSLLIEYACSLSESNGTYIGYRYYPT